MANVMTTAGSLACAHGGSAVLTSSAKLKVNGSSVLLETDIPSLAISPGCSQTATNSGQKVCTKFASFTGKAQKLTVGGAAVVLDTFSGTTDGAPDQHSAPASAGQSKLTAS